jgi:hypothetical protein
MGKESCARRWDRREIDLSAQAEAFSGAVRHSNLQFFARIIASGAPKRQLDSRPTVHVLSCQPLTRQWQHDFHDAQSALL